MEPTISPSEKCPLSKRQRQVLNGLVQGYSHKEVAKKLGIARNTVKNHLSLVMDKLNVRNTVSAGALAVAEGWLDTSNILRDREDCVSW